MIEFKTYDESSDLKLNGFQVFKDGIMKFKMELIKAELDYFINTAKSEDVFRTKLGDMKQIQNLHKSTNHFTNINAILARLINAEEYEILNNQLFCKPPNYKMTSAHQDNAYFESDEDVFTFWVPLQDVDLLNSCMFYVPNSHLQGLVKHDPIGTNVRTRTGAKGVSLYSSYYKNDTFVKVPMSLGDVLVHDKNTMHFSSPNLSDEYRIAATCIMKVNKYKTT